MTASTLVTPDLPVARRWGLAEWFTLRRHPLPEFVTSLAELPAPLAPLVQRWLPKDAAIRGALVVPPEYIARTMLAWEYVPDRALIFTDRAALYVAAGAPGLASQAMLLNPPDFLWLRSSLLLLYGLLEFKVECDGASSDVRLEYNTVIWPRLNDALSRFIAAACGPAPAVEAERAADANLSILNQLPFKFASGLRCYVLTPGERVQAAVFQRALWEGARFLPRQLTANTLFALTDRKLVFIEEQRSLAWRRPSQGEYGWIFTYIPRDRVVDMVVTPGARWSELKVCLALGGASDERTFVVEPSTAVQWQRAWSDATQ
jgi:hypothetical protein